MKLRSKDHTLGGRNGAPWGKRLSKPKTIESIEIFDHPMLGCVAGISVPVEWRERPLWKIGRADAQCMVPDCNSAEPRPYAGGWSSQRLHKTLKTMNLLNFLANPAVVVQHAGRSGYQPARIA